MCDTTIKLKRLCAGEYTYGDWCISKDEYEKDLWWVKHEKWTISEDVYSLKAARNMIAKFLCEV